MSIRILLVDDERMARETLRRYLGQVPLEQAFDIHEAANGMEAIEQIRAFRPQIVYLDIQMPKLTGFDVLRHFESIDFQLVFQTAYDEFALQAFEASACDYLLKPFTEERFRKSLDRALKGVLSEGQGAFKKLDEFLAAKRHYQDHLLLPVGDKSKVVPVREIIAFTSNDHETRMILPAGDFWFDQSLSHLERTLDPDQFIRIHRNTIINKSQIKSVTWGRPIRITMQNSVDYQVAKERAAALRKKIR